MHSLHLNHEMDSSLDKEAPEDTGAGEGLCLEGQCYVLDSPRFHNRQTPPSITILSPEEAREKTVLVEEFFNPAGEVIISRCGTEEHCFNGCQGGLNVLAVDSRCEQPGVEKLFNGINDNDSFTDEDELTEHVFDKNKSYSSTYRHVPHQEKPPHLVAKRNARERKRVQAVNAAFSRLRRVLPFAQGRSKRISKVRTLQEAINYIDQLQELIITHDKSYGIVSEQNFKQRNGVQRHSEPSHVLKDSSKQPKHNSDATEDGILSEDMNGMKENVVWKVDTGDENSIIVSIPKLPNMIRQDESNSENIIYGAPIELHSREEPQSNQFEKKEEIIYEANRLHSELSPGDSEGENINQVIVSSITNFM